ncbi:MAG: serine/threonine protein kinase [Deltaproteobacteria bacterium]|nr:serine/threonine protein kinase [Deltaproteobacteria bacterium]
MLPHSTGTVVAGRYLLKRELARGCMGAVWVGLDQRLRRPVAVKLMKLQLAGQGEARVRFEREAMAVAQLRSPHIVQIFDYGIDHDVPFIVMEMLDGYDLHAQLRRFKRLSLEQTVQLVAQAAKGLGAAHEVNIVHRDLKPANLFVVRTGEDELLKILDFGVAKANVNVDRDEDGEEVTKVGMVLGTPQYMAPEQARGLAAIDHRADLWSLGGDRRHVDQAGGATFRPRASSAPGDRRVLRQSLGDRPEPPVRLGPGDGRGADGLGAGELPCCPVHVRCRRLRAGRTAGGPEPSWGARHAGRSEPRQLVGGVERAAAERARLWHLARHDGHLPRRGPMGGHPGPGHIGGRRAAWDAGRHRRNPDAGGGPRCPPCPAARHRAHALAPGTEARRAVLRRAGSRRGVGVRGPEP